MAEIFLSSKIAYFFSMSSFPPSEVFNKKAILKNFSIFTRKHLCCSLFLIKLQAFRAATLLKKILQHRLFLMNIVKF